MSAERILILDDEADMVENCRRILSHDGYQCLTTTDSAEALRLIESEPPDLIITDLKMPTIDGLEVLARVRELSPQTPVIMLTAFATVESAVAAVKAGAFDYLPKPFTLDQLRVAVERALGQRRLTLENLRLREQLHEVYAFENIVGRSPAMAQVFELVRKAARSEASILIVGESGTGKELIARAIHANSPRAAEAFVAVDCASLPENLLESELFGHEKGSFTGALTTKPGLMELAHRGTLFLDEIGELPAGLQVKLFRALQERQVRRVGGTKQIDVDIRLVSATNRDLRDLAGKGAFREELYYRINVITVALPPLRARKGDVALLALKFLDKYGGNHERLRGFAPEALAALEAYSWPGNVRELQNIVERACALADGDTITLQDLTDHVRDSSPAVGQTLPPLDASFNLKDAREKWLGQLESAYVKEVLKRNGGNVSQAARAAGIDRKTLHRLLSKHHLR
ncbi:MAG: sigma-54 dependent transcriptional regulator [Candidatus Binataceae bacterium]